MYQVYMSLNGIGGSYELVHDPTGDDKELILLNGKISQSVDQIDSFTFDVYPNFKYWMQFATGHSNGKSLAVPYTGSRPGIKSMAYNTWMRVVDVDTGRIEFEGRVISMSPGMDSDGMVYTQVVCEGLEALLLDVAIDNREILTPGKHMILKGEDFGPIVLMDNGTFRVNPEWYFKQLMAEYNKAASSDKQMVIGDYEHPADTMINNHSSYYYAKATYGTVLYDELQSLLDYERKHAIDNGFWVEGNNVPDQYVDVVVSRNASGDLYCFIDDYTNNNKTVTGDGFDIELSSNMMSVRYDADYTDIVTAIEPFGKEYPVETEYTIDDFDFGSADNFADIERGTFTYDKPERIPLSTYLHYRDPDDHEHSFEDMFYPRDQDSDYSLSYNENIIVNNPGVDKYGYIKRPLIIDSFYHTREGSDGKTEYYVTSNDGFRFVQACLDYLAQHSKAKESITVKAVDLSLLPNYTKFSRFKLRQWYGIKNDLIGLSEVFPIVRRTINIDHPEESEIEFANKTPRETDYTYMASQKQKQKEAELGTADKDSGNIGQDNYAMAGVGIKSNNGGTSGGDSYISDYVIWTSATTGDANTRLNDFHVKYLLTDRIAWFEINIKLRDIAEALGFNPSDFEFGTEIDTSTKFQSRIQYVKDLPFKIVGVNAMNAIAPRSSEGLVDRAWVNNVVMASPPDWNIGFTTYTNENNVRVSEATLNVVFGVKNTFRQDDVPPPIDIFYAPCIRLHVLRDKRPGEDNISYGPDSDYTQAGSLNWFKTKRILMWDSNAQDELLTSEFFTGWYPETKGFNTYGH